MTENTPGAWRHRFHMPPTPAGAEQIYFTGNSLGLMPKAVRELVNNELDHWAHFGVEGHFMGSSWFDYHKKLTQQVAALVGAQPEEVVVMNSLTVNLHLMMVSFYQPKGQRNRIIMEAGAFPSDQYAVESQARLHGLNPEDVIVEVAPRTGEHTLRTEDILDTIREHGDRTALVLFGGVNYYTGQAYDMDAITRAGHEVGAFVGFDLAHAAGNLHLNLHNTGCDFAVWCTYKYLNSGPGGTSGVFIHNRHADNQNLPRLAGWWGHNEQSRFKMQKGFRPMHGAEGWQLSNAQILPMAAHRAALNVVDEAGGMAALRQMAHQLADAMQQGLQEILAVHPRAFTIITPQNWADRGCQTSLLVERNGRALFEYLEQQGVITDWREPNVIRIAPVPLYNTLDEVARFCALVQAFYHADPPA